MNYIIKGETHCDNISDIFKNKLVYKWLKQWHKKKYPGKNMDFRRKEETGSFTPEFYDFIQEIFSDRIDMEAFLAYVREDFNNNVTTSSEVWKYTSDQIAVAVLACEEIYTQLKDVSMSTVGNIFQTRVQDIIAHHENLQNSENRDFQVGGIWYILSDTLNHQVLPINVRGEIFSIIGDDEDTCVYSASIYRSDEIVDIDMNGNIVSDESRKEKYMQYLQRYNDMIAYHNGEDGIFDDDLLDTYVNQKLDFYEQNQDIEDHQKEDFFLNTLIAQRHYYELKLKKIGGTGQMGELRVVSSSHGDKIITSTSSSKPELKIVK
ncbi:hypothetical protein MK079_00580 [Candidatus Gracilibacteria bacterium]|nr:hypothetical protein [Candidatus Gracilibacteria bacterium]